MRNRQPFYDHIRKELFLGALTTKQVEGIELILNESQNRQIYRISILAYILATIFHETDKTMQPIEEYGMGRGKKYGEKIKYSGRPYTKPNWIFYGRGHTQNTWYEVYENLTKLAQKQGKNWDFLNNPNLLLQNEPSIWATFEAMQSGLYTGRKLSDFITDTKCNYLGARTIINGVDKAKEISDYAVTFEKALKLSV